MVATRMGAGGEGLLVFGAFRVMEVDAAYAFDTLLKLPRVEK